MPIVSCLAVRLLASSSSFRERGAKALEERLGLKKQGAEAGDVEMAATGGEAIAPPMA